jgi:hypothetical protein
MNGALMYDTEFKRKGRGLRGNTLRGHCRKLRIKGVKWAGGLTVARRINVVGQLGYSDREPRLDRGHYLLVVVGRDKSDRETLCAESTRATSAVSILLI